ncbi:hypothetical protein SAMN05216349_105111 [Oribacterium sp. KHPX15]|nr:hypothetical protein SAMN05216349_105111 [Oribacterium sp. KHPX15]
MQQRKLKKLRRSKQQSSTVKNSFTSPSVPQFDSGMELICIMQPELHQAFYA